MSHNIFIYILVAALTSALIRSLPLTLIRGKIENQFIQSFLFYLPYVTLAVMTFPAILQATETSVAGALALLAGIVLDTKNFTMRTGGRTFEAAAFLRRAGADTSDVQRLFQSDLAGMVERYDIIRHAELVHGDIAVAAVEKEIDRVTAAKAADELLTLSGIHTSVVLYKHGTGVNLSARSLGEINVQLIMEKLGGGGNRSAAAVQFQQGETLKEAVSKIYIDFDGPEKYTVNSGKFITFKYNNFIFKVEIVKKAAIPA